jgi:hypothetical protein
LKNGREPWNNRRKHRTLEENHGNIENYYGKIEGKKPWKIYEHHGNINENHAKLDKHHGTNHETRGKIDEQCE